MEHKNEQFSDKAVHLDGQAFTECTFRRCRLIFGGTAPTTLVNNDIGDCRFEFDGPALLTLTFLQALYRAGGREVVDGILQSIRSGGMKDTTPH